MKINFHFYTVDIASCVGKEGTMEFATSHILHNAITPEIEKRFYVNLTFEETRIINEELNRILCIFDEICRTNGLQYLMFAGALIGAVRNGSYLPWDDDIDLVMPRPDYNKFAEALRSSKYADEFVWKLPQDNEVITMGAHFYSDKVNLRELVSEKIGNSNIYESRAYLDVQPLDSCSDYVIVDKIKGFLVNFLQMAYISRRCFKSNDPFINYMAKRNNALRVNLWLRKGVAVLGLLIPKKVTFMLLGGLLRYNKRSKKLTASYGAQRYFAESISRDVWLPPKDLSFCGELVMVPNQPEKYLEHRYGDYKTVPTLDEQKIRMRRLRGDWQELLHKE